MLTLAFDTATSVATCALVRDGEVLGERKTRAVAVLADADELLREAAVEQGTTYVGDGAVRYRKVVEAAGGVVPPDESEAHLPRASLHARLAGSGGDAELVEPVYVRVPDAEQALA